MKENIFKLDDNTYIMKDDNGLSLLIVKDDELDFEIVNLSNEDKVIVNKENNNNTIDMDNDKVFVYSSSVIMALFVGVCSSYIKGIDNATAGILGLATYIGLDNLILSKYDNKEELRNIKKELENSISNQNLISDKKKVRVKGR